MEKYGYTYLIFGRLIPRIVEGLYTPYDYHKLACMAPTNRTNASSCNESIFDITTHVQDVTPLDNLR
jgi:hypothetical protein